MEGRSAPGDGLDETAPRLDGRDQFVLAFLLALGGWIGCVLLQALLYLRPAPYGGVFLEEWTRYFGLALYYDLLGVWLLSLPFFALWLILYRRRLRSAAWRIVPAVQLGLLAANLALSQIDHEVLRFLGLRLNLSFLLAYAQPQMLGDSLFIDLLRADRGGAFVPVLLLAARAGRLSLVGAAAAAVEAAPSLAGALARLAARSGAARRAGQRLADGDQPVPAAQGRAGAARFGRRCAARIRGPDGAGRPRPADRRISPDLARPQHRSGLALSRS